MCVQALMGLWDLNDLSEWLRSPSTNPAWQQDLVFCCMEVSDWWPQGNVTLWSASELVTSGIRARSPLIGRPLLIPDPGQRLLLTAATPQEYLVQVSTQSLIYETKLNEFISDKWSSKRTICQWQREKHRQIPVFLRDKSLFVIQSSDSNSTFCSLS